MAGYDGPEPTDGAKPGARAEGEGRARARRVVPIGRRTRQDEPLVDLEAGEGHAPCDPAFRHGVVVGYDGSVSSERALAYAMGMARRTRCGLVIVYVSNRVPTTAWAGCEPPVYVDLPDHRAELLGLELSCDEQLSDLRWVLLERGGDICHELEDVGREYEADAIVVGGTHGFVGKLFGSVAGRLARRANRPVIVIP